MVHPFDHSATVSGQGTLGRELDSRLDGFDTMVVATGGGGLIAGQVAWFGRRVRVVSVEPEGSQCLRAALHAGEPVDTHVGGVADDSLGARRLEPDERVVVVPCGSNCDPAMLTGQKPLAQCHGPRLAWSRHA